MNVMKRRLALMTDGDPEKSDERMRKLLKQKPADKPK
jgi:hypothetical protein